MPEIGMDLNRFILEEERKYANATGSLSMALTAIETATKIIASHVRMAGLADIIGKANKMNVQGEEVQKLDEFSNKALLKVLGDSGQFYSIASEEEDSLVFPAKGRDGKYVVAFDPLDGSTNIDVNVNIGTCFSIYRKITGNEEDFLQGGNKQIAAGYVIYGSSTMFVYTTGSGVNGFTLDPSVGLFLLSHSDMKLPDRGKIYSVNESNSKKWSKNVFDYFEKLKDLGYSARLIGTMIADVHRTILKGGIFAYPPDEKNKRGKLRALYEVFPVAFIIEQAGGMATDGERDILELVPSEIHERTPVFLGSRTEIENLLNMER